MFALGWGVMLRQTPLNRLSKFPEALCSITDECGSSGWGGAALGGFLEARAEFSGEILVKTSPPAHLPQLVLTTPITDGLIWAVLGLTQTPS